MYEFEYVDSAGNTQRIERRFKMSEAPQEVIVEGTDKRYVAKRVMSLTARMSVNWEVKNTASDLPPEHSHIL